MCPAVEAFRYMWHGGLWLVSRNRKTRWTDRNVKCKWADGCKAVIHRSTSATIDALQLTMTELLLNVRLRKQSAEMLWANLTVWKMYSECWDCNSHAGLVLLGNYINTIELLRKLNFTTNFSSEFEKLGGLSRSLNPWFSALETIGQSAFFSLLSWQFFIHLFRKHTA